MVSISLDLGRRSTEFLANIPMSPFAQRLGGKDDPKCALGPEQAKPPVVRACPIQPLTQTVPGFFLRLPDPRIIQRICANPEAGLVDGAAIGQFLPKLATVKAVQSSSREDSVGRVLPGFT